MMRLQSYVRIWILITLVLAYESFALNYSPQSSILGSLQSAGVFDKNLSLDPAPGKTVSLWLGWSGIWTIVLTNLYILRKRVRSMQKLGKVGNWLNFHIFCGMVGPVLILFHTNFKIGGLVAISFWSMVVSFLSGIVGRYFYIQVLTQKRDLDLVIQQCERQIQQFSTPISNETVERTKTLVMDLAGVKLASAASKDSMMGSIVQSIWGDIRLKIGAGDVTRNIPQNLRPVMSIYAVTQRRIQYLNQFRRLMGYWHAFHTPFAIFMYMVAIIHIVTALLLQV